MRLRVRRPAVALVLALVLGMLLTWAPAGAQGPGLVPTARVRPHLAGGARTPRLQVVAAFFPLAALARSVGGPAVRVVDVTPPGVDAHDLELTTDQVDALLDADLALVLGGSFQPAIERVAERRDGPTVVWRETLDADAQRRLDDDPHIWLDPVRYEDLATRLGERLADLDPGRARGYRRRAAEFVQVLHDFDTSAATSLTGCTRDLFVTSHESFGWLAGRYDLREVGVTRGSPDAEPDPARVADLADRARRAGVTTVFSEPLASDRVARTIAREAGGLRIVDLDPLEGLRGRRGEIGDGSDYLRVMRRNVDRLATALGCS